MTADRPRSNPCLTTWSIYDLGLSFHNGKMTATFVGELTTTLAAVTGHVTTQLKGGRAGFSSQSESTVPRGGEAGTAGA